VHIAHETAGAARTRSSLRPLTIEGEEYPAKLGRIASREREHTSSCHRLRRRIQCIFMIEPRSHGVLDTRLRGYDSLGWAALHRANSIKISAGADG
jgi:hypothetical protein